MTKKLAIFVEGQTELIFVLKAVKMVAQDRSLYIDAHRIGGGTHRVELYKMPVEEVGDADDAEVHILLVDCSSDERVVSYIMEQHPHLVDAGFSAFLGLRDLRPTFALDELEKLKNGIAATFAALEPAPEIAIAVQEIEAWFIAEASHFERVDPSLTPEQIIEATALDVHGNSEHLDTPAESLNEIYAIAGLAYTKSKDDVLRTTDALDLDRLLEVSPKSAPSADHFLTRLHALFQDAPAPPVEV